MPVETARTGQPPPSQEASDWAVEYTQQTRDPFKPSEPGRVRLTLLTDPWSVWCWGFEPVRRTVEHRYPSIEFQNLIGGMFEELPPPEQVGFDVGRFFAVVQRTTGMPIAHGAAQDDRPDSTYPACVAVHAVNLIDASVTDAYLRAMREAAYLDGLNISRHEVARDAAARVGIAGDAFDEAMDSGEPRREFEQRMALLERLDLNAYPTLLFNAGDKTARVDGFQALPNVLTVAESVSGRLHPTRPAPELTELVPEGQRVATREVSEVLECSVEAAAERLQDAGLERHRQPTGDVWTRG